MQFLNPGQWITWIILHIPGGINTFGTIYNWLILGLFIFMGLRHARREGQIRRDILEFRAGLEPDGSGLPARQVVDRWFADHPASSLRPFWERYRDALQHTVDQPETAPDITRYFSSYNLAYVAGDRRFTEAFPAILTMAGILGTFLGLAAGLAGLGPGNMTSGIDQLMGGLSLKFTSSVLGVGLALVWVLLDRGTGFRRWNHRAFSEAVTDLQERLRQLFPVPTEELLLFQIRQLQVQQQQNMNQLVNDALIPRLVEGFGSVIEGKLLPGILQASGEQTRILEQTQSSITEMADRMSTATESAAESQAGLLGSISRAFIEELSAKTTGFFEEMNRRLEQTISTQETLQEILEEFAGRVPVLVESMNQAAERQASVLESTSILNDLLRESAERWQELYARIDGSVRGLQEGVGNLVEQVTNVTGEAVQAVREAAEAAAQREEETVGLLTGAQGEMKAVVEQSRQHHQRTGEMLAAAEGWSRSLAERYGQFSSLLEGQVASLRQSAQGLSETLGNTESRIAHTVESLRTDLDSSLGRTFGQFDKELTRAVESLATGVNALTEVIESIEKGPLKAVRGERKTVEEDAARLSRTVSQVAEQLDLLAIATREAAATLPPSDRRP